RQCLGRRWEGFFFFSSRRRHTRFSRDWSSDVCSSDLQPVGVPVYLPGWQDRFAVDEWVSVTGTFASNPSVASMQATVLTPREIRSEERRVGKEGTFRRAEQDFHAGNAAWSRSQQRAGL